MPRQAGKADWTPAEIERGLAAWLRLGSAAAASRETGIPESTIRHWRARHPARFADHCLLLTRELRAMREEIAQEAAEGVREAVLVVRRALRGEAPINGREAAALLKALTTVDSSFDKIGRLDASMPTEIIQDHRSDSDLVNDIERALTDPVLRTAMERQLDERQLEERVS